MVDAEEDDFEEEGVEVVVAEEEEMDTLDDDWLIRALITIGQCSIQGGIRRDGPSPVL